MSRRLTLALVVLATVVGTMVPLAPTLYASWRLAVSAQLEKLDAYALRVLDHADAVLADAESALRTIAATPFPPCSPQHIRAMLQITEEALSVANIAYGAGDVVECNAWGKLTHRLERNPIQVEMPNGIGLVLNWRPTSFGVDRAMLVLRLREYGVLVDQKHFFNDWSTSDPFTISDIRTRSGLPLLASHRDRDQPNPPSASDASVQKVSRNWAVTVREPRITFEEHLRANWAVFLPLSAAIALLSAASGLLVLRRQGSPRGELAKALKNRELVAHYQPIIELATGRCIGAEALVRWPRADGSHTPPDAFIPLAEETGLIGCLTDQMIAAVVADLGDLLRSDPHAHVSINISAVDITTGRILTALDRSLDGSGIRPGQIWLEATERSFIDAAGACATLLELRRRGHRTAIDDFGTGYSGLSYIQNLPIDLLKIDRSFISAVNTEAPTRGVTPYIIAMGHELKLQIIAEGVETENQAEYLRAQGVSFAQGWLYAKALPADAFIVFWKAKRRENLSTLNQ
jgi:sensor c-di-GMP phosphodiesterase-like protein